MTQWGATGSDGRTGAALPMTVGTLLRLLSERTTCADRGHSPLVGCLFARLFVCPLTRAEPLPRIRKRTRCNYQTPRAPRVSTRATESGTPPCRFVIARAFVAAG